MSPQKPLERISGIIPDFCLWKWLYCEVIYTRSLDFTLQRARGAGSYVVVRLDAAVLGYLHVFYFLAVIQRHRAKGSAGEGAHRAQFLAPPGGARSQRLKLT